MWNIMQGKIHTTRNLLKSIGRNYQNEGVEKKEKGGKFID